MKSSTTRISYWLVDQNVIQAKNYLKMKHIFSIIYFNLKYININLLFYVLTQSQA